MSNRIIGDEVIHINAPLEESYYEQGEPEEADPTQEEIDEIAERDDDYAENGGITEPTEEMEDGDPV